MRGLHVQRSERVPSPAFGTLSPQAGRGVKMIHFL